MSQAYSVISLFSGAMGLDLGMHQTGRYRLRACVEKEKAFAQTIVRNQQAGRLPGDLAVYARDIRDLDPAEVLSAAGLAPGQLDVLVGGPPCQSFSTAGRRGTVQDVRGTLLWEFLRFVDYMQPKVFILENVRGLLSAAIRHRPISLRPEKGGAPLSQEEQPGSVVRLFADDLRKIDGVAYHMDCFEVNAVNYGAPQLRERAIFIGNRIGIDVDFPDPTHAQPNSNGLPPWRTLGDAIGGLKHDPADTIMDFSPRKKRFLAQVPEGANWRSLPLAQQQESMGKAWHAKGGRSGWWRRLSYDLPCPTLVTMPNHASTSLCHPSEVRALSIREYAAIQEFPRDWEFHGTATQQYAQVGNAVPVRLGAIAGEVVAGALDSLADRKTPHTSVRPDHFRVVYIQSHVRTRQWFKSGQTHIWRTGNGPSQPTYDAPATLRKSRAMQG